MEKYYQEWNGVKYPVRIVKLSKEIGVCDIADIALWDAMKSAYEDEQDANHKKAVVIDEKMFYYVESDFMASDPSDEELAYEVLRSTSLD